MSTTLRKSRLIENCTSSISYDAQVKSACAAIDPQCYEIIDDTPVVIMIPNIMALTDSKLVDILAWQFHVDFYDATRPLEFRKRLVQMSIEWHRTKGTKKLVEDVIDTYWPGSAWLQEWFEYPSWGEQTISVPAANVNVAQNKIAPTGTHPFANGDQVWWYVGTADPATRAGEVLPQPFTNDRYYYVVGANPSQFQLALTPGGAVIDILDAGTGTNSIGKRVPGSGFPPNYPHPAWHDRYRFRIMLNEDMLVSPEEQAQVLELIDRYKPISRWPDGIVHPHHGQLKEIFVAGAAQLIIRRFSAMPTQPPTSP